MIKKKECLICVSALAMGLFAQVVQQPVVTQPVVVQQPVVVAGPAGRVLPPGYMWCSKCGGDGYNRTWYGMPKKCNICGGDGMRRIHGGKHMPPPRHVHKPAPKHPPKHVAKKPAHKPAHKPVSRPKSSKGHGRR
jgi:hypothetical protein